MFNAGSNNTLNGSAPLAGFAPQGGAASATPFNAATLNPAGSSFLVSTGFIGAVANASDTAFRDWTCSSATLNFTGAASYTAAQACTTSLARTTAALSLFGSNILLSYHGTARFEKGSAPLTATLIVREGRFRIYNFSFGSPQTP